MQNPNIQIINSIDVDKIIACVFTLYHTNCLCFNTFSIDSVNKYSSQWRGFFVNLYIMNDENLI